MVASSLVAGLLVVALAAPLGVYAQVPAELTQCFSIEAEPREPLALSFCHRYNDNACCIPGHDAENEELFLTMHDVGLSCRIRGDVRDTPLAQLYCLNCDPNQPQYVRLVAEGGKDASMLLCENWVNSSFPMNLQEFDQCGLLVSSPCQGDSGELDDRDRYTCGDDLVIPSTLWDDGMSRLENFEAFFNLPSLGTPGIDEDYNFKIVESRPCTAAEAMEASPRCLLTAAQLSTKYGVAISRPEQCFGSGAIATPMIAALLASLMAALVFLY